ncbi:MAG TPA: GAF domain-containing sensor histidine kinase [Candidatus Dormibacteraeota bacterium]|nr:GAF domain-containing sensor histidine kinase [Candidatus Dormibacteraeota bacterium]
MALEVIDDFNSVSDPGELVRQVLLRAVVETRSDRGIISWIAGDEMIVADCYDPAGEIVPAGSQWPLAGEQVTALALTGGGAEAGSYRGVATDVLSPALAETFRGLGQLLVAPVRVGGEDVAVLCVSRRGNEDYSTADSRVLEAVAAAGAQPLRAARLEELLHEALAELSHLATRAQAVEVIKTDVLRLASHELRTPLTVLHGYLSLVDGGFYGEIPEPLAGVMRILKRRTADMNSLVNDMLVAARVEDGPADAEREVADLREVLQTAAAEVMPRASTHHRLELDLPDDPVLARVDREWVVLALRNIIDNAVKYSPAGGDVLCTVIREDGLAHVQVADHGMGIALEDRDKLFTRFGRVLTTANSHIPGIGLGLYFSREVARRHGGDVALVDGREAGTTFELTLPITDDD